MAVAAIIALSLLAVAFVSTVLVEKFECGGEEAERPPAQGSALRDYCDAQGSYLSLVAPVLVALGWLLTRRSGNWSPLAVSCVLAAALAVSPIAAAVLWHPN